MIVHRLLEIAPLAMVLGRRADAIAKTLYFPWIHNEFQAAMDDILHGEFRLGSRRVNPLEGWIEGPRGVERVQPKVMDVLLCLARNPGQVVERDTIVNEVWDGRPATDDVLTRCISELRHVLDDSSGSPTYIQTIPKRGYRLIAEVEPTRPHAKDSADSEADFKSGGFIDRHLQDLKKRKVFQTVFGYPVLAWLLVQIIDVMWEYLLQPMGAPVWLVPSFVVLLALGYPIAVFLSWAIDLTPEGMRLTKGQGGTTPFWGLSIIGIASVAMTAAALFAYFNAYEATEPLSPSSSDTEVAISPMQKSIAVLRFLNISEDPAIGYVGDGLTEELIHELTNLRSLKVAARTSVWPFSTRDLHVTEIAELLSVERVLEGSIRSDGDKIRVTAQLIDRDGFHLWSETYDRQLRDVLDIQKDIATRVVNELDLLLSDESQERLVRQPTVNSEAYDQYLQGRQHLRQPASAESIASATELFDTAIVLDGRFPLAYAGLCEAHLANYRLTRATEHFERAEIACHRALTLDGGLAEVYTALGNLYRHFGQQEKALQEYEVALGINPMLEEANYGVGRVYQAQGRLAEAEDILRRGVDIEPGYWGSHIGLGNFLFRQGRYEESLASYRKVTEIAPDDALGFINLGATLHWLGEWDEAENAWRRALELEPDAIAYQNMGTLYYYQQRFSEAVEMHQKATEIAPLDHSHWGKLAAAERYAPGQEAASGAAYQRAIELVQGQLAVNPDEPEDLYHLSAYLTNTGDHEAARAAMERSLFLVPESPSAHYFAAILEMNSGNTEKALSELEKASELGYSLKNLAVDPEFEELRTYSEFAALLENNNN
jgi:TolB-like protein/DNA-binding winged helix-turn-helix (wHTH) protein/Flp pilus assembly protein TadD